uniref:Phosphoglycerate kinase n=4 Tax=Oryza TaxID=4527 RepID=A0A0E0JW27_ORYPU
MVHSSIHFIRNSAISIGATRRRPPTSPLPHSGRRPHPFQNLPPHNPPPTFCPFQYRRILAVDPPIRGPTTTRRRRIFLPPLQAKPHLNQTPLSHPLPSGPHLSRPHMPASAEMRIFPFPFVSLALYKKKNPSSCVSRLITSQSKPSPSSSSSSRRRRFDLDPIRSDPREEEGGEEQAMATKRSVGTLGEADLRGKKVFVRADLNVPLDDAQKITDDTRIRASVPTVKFLLEKGAKVILASHLGRPKGVTPKYSLKPLVPRLSELLGVDVVMANDCIGEEVEKLAAALPEGGVLLLENVRFYKEEEKNDPEFAKKLASVADLYVNDAFGTAHRAHASTEGVTKFLKPAVAGFLMQKELDYLVGAVANPKKPFAAIVGGSKVSTKIGVIESLLAKVDVLILGGGMIFTFYKAQGYAVGKSLVEEDKLELATSLIEKAKAKGVSLLLPTDVVVADKFAADAESKTVAASAIPDGWMGLDVGPDAIKTFSEALDTCNTIIWNGPMGVFEFEKFAAGTDAIAKKLADLTTTKGATTIIGGGDSVAAVEKAGLADKMSHISTGGGASLELLEGKTLPGVLALDEA